jgi:hypothetical protein
MQARQYAERLGYAAEVAEQAMNGDAKAAAESVGAKEPVTA